MRRWLVTGGCGFLGRNLVRELSSGGGDQVRIFDNLLVGSRQALLAAAPLLDPGKAENGLVAAELTPGDILDAAAMRTAAAGRDIVVHFAANTGVAPSVADPWNDCMVNVLGTLTCLEAARYAKWGALFSAFRSTLGELIRRLMRRKWLGLSHHTVPASWRAKVIACAYHRTFGIGTVVLRFGNVYGPHWDHKSSVVAAFVPCALAGEPLLIHGDGRQTRDFIFVDDLVQAILRAAAVPEAAGHVFQIATSRETTIIELAELLVDVLEENGVTGVRLERGPRRIGDVTRNFSDTSKALRVLGWRAEVPLREGLSRTVKWFMTSRPCILSACSSTGPSARMNELPHVGLKRKASFLDRVTQRDGCTPRG